MVATFTGGKKNPIPFTLATSGPVYTNTPITTSFTPTGYDGNVTVTVKNHGATVRKNSTGSFGSSVVIQPGDTVNVQVTSPSAYSTPYSSYTNPIDVWIIAGQSNAVGFPPNTASAPTCTVNRQLGYVYSTDSVQNPIVATWDSAAGSTGSAWPEFGIVIDALSGGRPVFFIQTGVGGSSLSTAAYSPGVPGFWDPSYDGINPVALGAAGQLFSRSITIALAGIAKISSLGWTPILRGVLWCQGENDGGFAISTASYQSLLTSLAAAYRASLSRPTMPFFVFRTGAFVGVQETTPNVYGIPTDYAFQAIRQAQENFCLLDYNYMVSRDAVNLLPSPAVLGIGEAAPVGSVAFRNEMRSLTYLPSPELHYNQDGYNDMGFIGATEIYNQGFATTAWQINSLIVQVKIGTITAPWMVNTLTNPVLQFAAKTGQPVSTFITQTCINASNLAVTYYCSASTLGGDVSNDGGATWHRGTTILDGVTVSPGGTLTVRCMSSASHGVTTTATVIGEISSTTFSVTTA